MAMVTFNLSIQIRTLELQKRVAQELKRQQKVPEPDIDMVIARLNQTIAAWHKLFKTTKQNEYVLQGQNHSDVVFKEMHK